jgi:hypothetical protein
MTKNAALTQESIYLKLQIITPWQKIYCIISCTFEMMRSSSVSANLSG